MLFNYETKFEIYGTKLSGDVFKIYFLLRLYYLKIFYSWFGIFIIENNAVKSWFADWIYNWRNTSQSRSVSSFVRRNILLFFIGYVAWIRWFSWLFAVHYSYSLLLPHWLYFHFYQYIHQLKEIKRNIKVYYIKKDIILSKLIFYFIKFKVIVLLWSIIYQIDYQYHRWIGLMLPMNSNRINYLFFKIWFWCFRLENQHRVIGFFF
jgi:hypothetical protein